MIEKYSRRLKIVALRRGWWAPPVVPGEASKSFTLADWWLAPKRLHFQPVPQMVERARSFVFFQEATVSQPRRKLEPGTPGKSEPVSHALTSALRPRGNEVTQAEKVTVAWVAWSTHRVTSVPVAVQPLSSHFWRIFAPLPPKREPNPASDSGASPGTVHDAPCAMYYSTVHAIEDEEEGREDNGSSLWLPRRRGCCSSLPPGMTPGETRSGLTLSLD